MENKDFLIQTGREHRLDSYLFFFLATNLEDIVSASVTATTAGTVALFSSAGAGVKSYITDITIASSGGTFMYVALLDGNTTTSSYTFPVPSTGGVTHSFSVPLRGSAGTIWYAQLQTAPTSAGSVSISAVGFKSKL